MEKPQPKPMTPRATRRRVITCLLAVPLSLLVAELALRFVLFNHKAADLPGASSLRSPGLFAALDNHTADDYWKLYQRFTPADERWHPQHQHPDAGWLSDLIESKSFTHLQTRQLAGRRPILLYGSSHARASQEATLRYQELLDETDQGQSARLLNYAVAAHGLAQSLMVFERSIEHYSERDPLVIFTVMIDRDLSRSTQSLRQAPKPYFDLDDRGQLTTRLPTTTDLQGYLEAHPIQITSYLWRYLVYGTHVFPGKIGDRLRGGPDAVAYRDLLLGKALERVQQRCLKLGVELCIVTLQSEATTASPELESWPHQALTDHIQSLGLNHINAAKALRESASLEQRPVADYYIQTGASIHHPNDLGMRVLFEVFQRGIAGDYDQASKVAAQESG